MAWVESVAVYLERTGVYFYFVTSHDILRSLFRMKSFDKALDGLLFHRSVLLGVLGEFFHELEVVAHLVRKAGHVT